MNTVLYVCTAIPKTLRRTVPTQRTCTRSYMPLHMYVYMYDCESCRESHACTYISYLIPNQYGTYHIIHTRHGDRNKNLRAPFIALLAVAQYLGTKIPYYRYGC